MGQMYFHEDPNKPTKSRHSYAFLGVPFEYGAASGTGQANGPQAVRQAIYSKRWAQLPAIPFPIEDIDLFDEGDVLAGIEAEEAVIDLKEDIAGQIQANRVPIIIGGDDSINRHIINELQEGIDLVLHLDAHQDNQLSADHDHATWVTDVLNECPDLRVHTIGSRSPHDPFTPGHERHDIGDWLPSLTGKRIYLAVDIDVLDPVFAPEVVAPIPGGWASGQFLQFMKNFGKEIEWGTLVAASFTELAPTSFSSSPTADVIAYGLAYLLASYEADW